MSHDHDREEQHVKDAIEQSRRAANYGEEVIPEEELLYVRPKAKPKKKKNQLVREEG